MDDLTKSICKTQKRKKQFFQGEILLMIKLQMDQHLIINFCEEVSPLQAQAVQLDGSDSDLDCTVHHVDKKQSLETKICIAPAYKSTCKALACYTTNRLQIDLRGSS